MNRTILISTDTFAAIWAQRQNGEEDEDTILRRLLGCHSASPKRTESSIQTGFRDKRNNVTFPPGFVIFRNYKNKEYMAVAENGVWRRMDNNSIYTSLNKLNASITTGNENVWNGNWKFKDSNSRIISINALRS